MSWLRLDDRFSEHAKIVSLTRSERWTWLELLLYCARQQDGGKVLPGVCDVLRHVTPAFLARCVTAGLLDTVGGGFQVHHWQDHNPPRDATAATRQQRRRHALRHGHVTRDVTRDDHRDVTESHALHVTPRAQQRAPDPSLKIKTPFSKQDMDRKAEEDAHASEDKIDELIGIFRSTPRAAEKVHRAITARHPNRETLTRAINAAQAPCDSPLAVALAIIAPPARGKAASTDSWQPAYGHDDPVAAITAAIRNGSITDHITLEAELNAHTTLTDQQRADLTVLLAAASGTGP